MGSNRSGLRVGSCSPSAFQPLKITITRAVMPTRPNAIGRKPIILAALRSRSEALARINTAIPPEKKQRNNKGAWIRYSLLHHLQRLCILPGTTRGYIVDPRPTAASLHPSTIIAKPTSVFHTPPSSPLPVERSATLSQTPARVLQPNFTTCYDSITLNARSYFQHHHDAVASLRLRRLCSSPALGTRITWTGSGR